MNRIALLLVLGALVIRAQEFRAARPSILNWSNPCGSHAVANAGQAQSGAARPFYLMVAQGGKLRLVKITHAAGGQTQVHLLPNTRVYFFRSAYNKPESESDAAEPEAAAQPAPLVTQFRSDAAAGAYVAGQVHVYGSAGPRWRPIQTVRRTGQREAAVATLDFRLAGGAEPCRSTRPPVLVPAGVIEK